MRWMLLLLVVSCGRELPDLFGCDDPPEISETLNGDVYTLKGECWTEESTEYDCCRYAGVGFDCEQVACSSDCHNYVSRGVTCEGDAQ